MAFIELKNIGKIYVSEGSIGVGIRGVNLSFDRHEFVAITGQSGAGKSTLLNVISGIDSYEEGEMYVEGEPTSHYIQQDWEEYRKKYISFIFQDYNIIESMTVLQNVELSLMHIEDPKVRRQKAIELLKRVGMESHLRHKGSHLSGGQKQRTVIARALSKDSPIILADEPTGNLDSQSSREIIELLREVSKDKLVIVVTHSFDELSEHATRHIRVFDGAIESDQVLSHNSTPDEAANEHDTAREPKEKKSGKSEFFKNIKNGLLLGRIRYFSKPRLSIFISLLLILATLAVTLISSMFGDIPEVLSKTKMFTHINGRVIISRNDGEVITDEELEQLAKDLGAPSYLHHDYLLDFSSDSGNWFDELINGSDSSTIVYSYDSSIKPSVGRAPEADCEIMLSMPLSEQPVYGKDTILEPKYELGNITYDVVGINYYIDNNKTPKAVFTESGFKLATALALYDASSSNFRASVGFDSEMISSYSVDFTGNEWANQIYFSFDLARDEYAFSSPIYDSAMNAIDGLFKSLEESGIKIDKSAILDTRTVSLTGSVESKGNSNFNLIDYINDYIGQGSKKSEEYTLSLDGYKESDNKALIASILGGNIGFVMSPYIIQDFMEQLYYPSSYTQASLMFRNDLSAHMNVKKLEDRGYTAVTSDTTVKSEDYFRIIAIIGLLFEAVIWFLAMVFIALLLSFVTTKAMAAGAGDIGIMRSMGIPVKVIKISIYVQTLIALVPSYIGMLLFGAIVYRIPETNAMFTYMYWWQYLIIALGVLIIDVRLSRRYVKSIFKASVKNTLKGGPAA